MEKDKTQYYKSEDTVVKFDDLGTEHFPTLWVNTKYGGCISLNKLSREELLEDGFEPCTRKEFDDVYNKIALKFISRRNTVNISNLPGYEENLYKGGTYS